MESREAGSQPGSARASLDRNMTGSVLLPAASGSGALLPILEHKQYANEPAEPPMPLAAPVSTHSTASRVIKGEVGGRGGRHGACWDIAGRGGGMGKV